MRNARFIAALTLVPFVLASCGGGEAAVTTESAPAKAVVTQKVAPKPFAEEIRLVGRVSGTRETTVSALVSGTVKTVNAKVGQKVKAGEILAALDSSTNALGVSANTAASAYANSLLSYQYTQTSNEKDAEAARVQLENAKSNKANTYASTDKQLSLAQAQLDNANTTRANTYTSTDKQLAIAKTQLANVQTTKQNSVSTTSQALESSKISVELAQKAVDNATLSLDNFRKNSAETLKTLEDKRAGLYATAKVSVESAKSSLDSALVQADMILGVTAANRDANDAYEPYLAGKNTDLKPQAENAFNAANDAFAAYKASENLTSDVEISASIDRLLVVYDRTVRLYELVTDVLNATLVSSSFPQAQLDALKATIATKQSAMLGAKSNFVATKNGLQDMDNSLSSTRTSTETNEASLETALAIATNQLQSAKQGLASVQAGNTSNLDSVSGNETLLRDQLESTIATIQSSRDSVDSALRIAREQYESTVLAVKTSRDNADNALKVAQSQYDSTRAKLASALAGARTQMDSSKGQRDSASIQYDNTMIRAPFDGVILQKSVEVGTLVSPGAAVFSIGSDSGYIVRMDVSSDTASALAVGQSVGIVRNGRTFTGAISLVSAGADPTTKLLRAEAVFSDNAAALKDLAIGDFVDVYAARSAAKREAILVPFSALMSGEQGSYSVYVVGSGDIAEQRSVTLGDQNSHETEITGGLKAGDRVIVSGTLNVQVGDKVAEQKN